MDYRQHIQLEAWTDGAADGSSVAASHEAAFGAAAGTRSVPAHCTDMQLQLSPAEELDSIADRLASQHPKNVVAT